MPHYTHDCRHCEYIRSATVVVLEEVGPEQVDFYSCGLSKGNEIVMRRGNNGPDYISMGIVDVLRDSRFSEAL